MISGAALYYSQMALKPPSLPVQVILTSGSTWTVPSDWNSANNKIECIGGSGFDSYNSGGGGAYAVKNNVALTVGASVAYSVGGGSSGASGMPSYFVSSSFLKANGGHLRFGGLASDSIGDTVYSGGDGNSGGYGGGGAAGPHGAGQNGTAGNGGAGDAGYGGAGGVGPSGNGGAGTEWGTAGSGGGGGGSTSTYASSAGGNYGGGRGGSPSGTIGAPAGGVIVITYTP